MFNINHYFMEGSSEQFDIELRDLAENIPEPKSYFQGLPSNIAIVPENIILFYRRKRLSNTLLDLHHRFVLLSNLGGTGSIIIDSKIFKLNSGESILVYPHQFHTYADIESEKISWLFITFEVENHGVLSSKGNSTFKLTDYAKLNLALLISNYNLAIHLTQKSSFNPRLLLASILSEMTNTPNQNSKPEKILNKDSFPNSLELIQKIVEHIYQNLNKPIQIKDVAKQIHFSPSYLSEFFKKTMGVGLGSFIRRARIHRACFLIRSTNLTFSQVTDKCGFSSLFSFSRLFRQEIKMSPTEYKKQYSKI